MSVAPVCTRGLFETPTRMINLSATDSSIIYRLPSYAMFFVTQGKNGLRKKLVGEHSAHASASVTCEVKTNDYRMMACA